MHVLTETLDPEIPMNFEESTGSKSLAQDRQGAGMGMGVGRNAENRLLVERMKRGEARLKELRIQVSGCRSDKTS